MLKQSVPSYPYCMGVKSVWKIKHKQLQYSFCFIIFTYVFVPFTNFSNPYAPTLINDNLATLVSDSAHVDKVFWFIHV